MGGEEALWQALGMGRVRCRGGGLLLVNYTGVSLVSGKTKGGNQDNCFGRRPTSGCHGGTKWGRRGERAYEAPIGEHHAGFSWDPPEFGPSRPAVARPSGPLGNSGCPPGTGSSVLARTGPTAGPPAQPPCSFRVRLRALV